MFKITTDATILNAIEHSFMITGSTTTQRMPKLIKSCLASVAKLHLWQLYRLLGTNEVDPSLQIQYFVKIQSKRIFGFFYQR